MMNKIFSVLRFIRVVDEQDRLSVTNLAAIGSFIALMLRPEVGAADVATFAVTIAGYGVKRFFNGGSAEQDNTALAAAVASLETKVTGLQMGQQRTGR